MKTKLMSITLGLMILASIGVVYAHGTSSDNNAQSEWQTNHVMMYENTGELFKNMNEMHKSMTENMEPELKEQMNLMHQSCMGQVDETPTVREEHNMMGRIGMMMR